MRKGEAYAISIHAPRAGSDYAFTGVHRKCNAISIHAPRAGSDHPQPMLPRWCMHFNPRSPCGERRAVRFAARLTDSFQSTLPVRGATRRPKRTYQRDETISIHAPRAGSDMENVPNHTAAVNFNPRSPCGERRSHWNLAALHSYFNPRSPCGERHGSLTLHRRKNRRFQSTLPVRGATIRMREPDARSSNISIHAPRAGSDALKLHLFGVCVFQSTLPVRGATAIYCAFASSKRNIYSISYSKHCERYKRQTSFNRIRCESLWNFLRASNSHS